MKRLFVVNSNMALVAIISFVFLLCTFNLSFAEIPQRINYQGRLTDTEGRLVPDGDYDMIFSIYDAQEEGNQEWMEPWIEEEGHAVPVTNGLFSVPLGTHEPIDLDFDEYYWVEVQVYDTESSSWETFEPRQQIVSVGYAFMSEKVAEGTITNLSISDTARIAGVKIEPNFENQNIVTTADITATSFNTDVSATELNCLDGVNAPIQTQLDNIVSSQWNDVADGINYNAGNVGIGTTSTGEGELRVAGDIYAEGAIGFAAPGSRWAANAIYREHGDDFTTLRNFTQPRTVFQIYSPPGSLAETREATISLVRGDDPTVDNPNLEFVDFYNNGYQGVEVQHGIRIQKRGDGQYRDFVFDYSDNDGATTTEALRLNPNGDVNIGGDVFIRNGSPYIHLKDTDSDSTEQGLTAYISFADRDGTPVGVIGDHTPNKTIDICGYEGYSLRFVAGYVRRMIIKDNNGFVGIGTMTPEFPLELSGSGLEADFVITDPSPAIGFRDTQTGFDDFRIGVDVSKLHIEATSTSDFSGLRRLVSIQSNGNVGIGTTTPQRKLHVAGIVKCSEIQTDGGDIAEPFEIKESDKVKPGMVLVIDPDNPGKLKISDRAYNRCVAGIVSGAGGIKPGLKMMQRDSLTGEHHVALTGRVYALCDASSGSIKPGDLLTTSSTPGYAMKVTDNEKAQGAILGKAMTELEEGQGLVLVLVTLQ